MKMKRFLGLGLALTMSMSVLAGCGAKEEAAAPAPAEKEEVTEEAAPEEEAAPADAIVLQVGFENSMSEPIGQALEKWQSLLAEKSGGAMAIELFPDSQLGSKNELIDSMLLGEPVCTLADGAFYADYGVPDFGIVFGPFLFDNWDQAWTLTESDWYAEQSGLLEEKGLKLVASNWMYGARHLLTVDPVNTVEDLAGMKIRVPGNQIQTEGFNALGAAATGMDLGDVYQALQTKTIDGGENPLSTLYGRKFQEVSKCLFLSGHVLNFTTWVVSNDWFNTLSAEQQAMLVETAKEAGVYNNELAEAAEAEYLQKMVDEGCTVVEPTEEVLAGFREKAMSFYDMGETFGWSEGLYDTVRAAMGAK